MAAAAAAMATATSATATPPLRIRDAARRTRRRGHVRCAVASGAAEAPAAPGARVSADCVVVGGGISGLCTAQALATKHGVGDVLVTEARARPGGNITTAERAGEGYLWEEGPNSFQPSDPVLTMAVDSGLKDDLVFGDPNAPRFVLWEGKLRPVPSKPGDLPFFDLMSIPGKLRAGLGALGVRPPPPVCVLSPLCILDSLVKFDCAERFRRRFQGREESVEDFVRRNLGAEVFERLIEPFCSGVYAGDPSKLSMKAAFGKVWRLEDTGGSIIGGTIKTIQERGKNPKPPRDPRLPTPKGQTVASFRKGLTMLPDAITSRLGSKVKLSWKLTSITKSDNKGYALVYETPEGVVSVQAKTVVMTIPSYVASDILRPLSSDAADALSIFYYPPVAAVTVSYPKEAIRKECLIDGELQGFGQLHPRSQGVETLGTIYSSSLFPNRAPAGRVLLLNYIGGSTNTGIVSKTESELVEAVDRDLRKMLINPRAVDPLVLGVRVWPQAIPQFLIGHLDHLEAAKSALGKGGYDGLFLGGNYVAGVALGRCVEGAYESASQISDYLTKYAYK
uniref:Protoporphyrinogen oxidase n=1 Tax=Oryza nivara TaxID=4536 RepID=A0A0E0FKA7_ORYNI